MRSSFWAPSGSRSKSPIHSPIDKVNETRNGVSQLEYFCSLHLLTRRTSELQTRCVHSNFRGDEKSACQGAFWQKTSNHLFFYVSRPRVTFMGLHCESAEVLL